MTEPWNEWQKYDIPEEFLPKEKREGWLANPDTNYASISGTEGIDARLRVSNSKGDDSNEPVRIHALIADYDHVTKEDKLAKDLAKARCDYRPNYVCDSPSAGKHRLIWLLETPVAVCNKTFADAFYGIAKKRLKLTSWTPGFDEHAWTPSHYYSIGKNWRQLSVDPVPTNAVRAWAKEAISTVRLFNDSERPVLPMDVLSAAVNDQFPGRWAGEFAVGAQGVRFWDPQADNSRAALVTEQGMICFTGPQTFMSWEDIFGRKFVDEAVGKTGGSIMDRAHYQDSPEKFYLLVPDKGWLPFTPTRFKEALTYEGISPVKPRNRDQSPVAKLMHEVATFNRIERAQHFVYQKPGKLLWGGKWYLNINDVKVLQPGPEIEFESTDFDWVGPRYFEWHYSFFSNFFVAPKRRPRWAPADVPLEKIPLYIYLAWLQRMYLSGLYYRPTAGQAVVFAGTAGTGKTYMVTGPCQRLLGKAIPAEKQLVGGQQWTDELVTGPINYVDDSSAAASVQGYKLYEAAIKRLVANQDRDFNKKYGGNGVTEWPGRVFICCNTDPESLRVLPNLEQSTAEKISMYLVKPGVELPGRQFQEQKLAEDMPYFARWLTVWEPPAWVLGPGAQRGRFGTRAYHHEILREEAMSSGTSTPLLSVLRDMYEDWKEDPASAEAFSTKKTGDKTWVWRGRDSRLQHELSKYNEMFARHTTLNQLKLMLGTLASRGFGVERESSGQLWTVHFDERLLRPPNEDEGDDNA